MRALGIPNNKNKKEQDFNLRIPAAAQEWRHQNGMRALGIPNNKNKNSN